MSQASRRFRELYHADAVNGQLRVLNDSFSERNIDNFLKLCQNLPNDVQDSEMEEICTIAKLFQADQIYKTGVDFVRSSIDPSFDVQEFDTSHNFIFEEKSTIIHHANVEDLDFESDSESQSTDSSERRRKEQERREREKREKNSKSKKSKGKKSKSDKKKDYDGDPDAPPLPVVYEIRAEKPMMKCARYYMRVDGKTKFSAKKKGGKIFIAKGSDVHVSAAHNHIAFITQYPFYNKIWTEKQEINLKYVRCVGSGAISMSVSFNHEDRQLNWFPKEPVKNPRTGQYAMKLSGCYKHVPIASKRNCVMKNAEGQTTFILRKMADNFFEVECHPALDLVVVFSLALSAIVGPSIDYGGSA